MIRKQKEVDGLILFWLWVLVAFIVGAFLRLYLLPEQIILNDEWHGMSLVTNKSFSDLLLHFNRRANSIPLNVYRFFLLHTFGWSEFSLRIPALCAGLAALIVLPVLVRQLLNARTAIFFAFFYAVSPFLILYSRMARAYGIIAFLAPLSFLACLLWAQTGKRKYAIIYFFSGVSVVFFHLTPVITVFAPLGILMLARLFHPITTERFPDLQNLPSMRTLLCLASGMGIVCTALLLPAFLQNPWWTNVTRETDYITIQTLVGFASLVAGSSNVLLSSIFWSMTIIGVIFSIWKKPFFGFTFISVFILYFAGLSMARWETVHVSVEFTRFCISFVPLVLIVLGFSFDRLIFLITPKKAIRPNISLYIFKGFALSFICALIFFSPIKNIYYKPNNFTNHSVFNESYDEVSWEKSYKSEILPGFRMKKESISPFYFSLSKNESVDSIIEYPLFIGDHFNLYYYYQRFHQKRVVAGYLANLTLAGWPYGDYVYGDMYVDYVLSRVGKPEGYHFRNMVDMKNINAIRSTKTSFIILHKNLYREMFPHLVTQQKFQRPYEPVEYLKKLYENAFGPPVFEDRNIVVFGIKSS